MGPPHSLEGVLLSELVPAPTTDEAHDPDALFDTFTTWTADRGLTLYPAQEEALIELVSGSNVILATPTGSGKSMVAVGAHFAAMAAGKRSFYTAPIKALVSEKFFALCDIFGASNVGMMTGDASVNSGAPIICATAEIVAKYGFGASPPGFIAVVHGWVYALYLVLTVDLAVKARWRPLPTIGVLIAGTVPFLSFVVEHLVTGKVRRGEGL